MQSATSSAKSTTIFDARIPQKVAQIVLPTDNTALSTRSGTVPASKPMKANASTTEFSTVHQVQKHQTSQGKSAPSALMHIKQSARHHPVAALLQQYVTPGCPVDCGPQWTESHIHAALQRGPHVSAK